MVGAMCDETNEYNHLKLNSKYWNHTQKYRARINYQLTSQ